jgi:hypothetical protein
VALTDRRIDAGNPIEQHDRRSWPLGSVPKVVVKTPPSGLHSLKSAPSENAEISGCVRAGGGAIGRHRTLSSGDFRAIVEATASASANQFIRLIGKGKTWTAAATHEE